MSDDLAARAWGEVVARHAFFVDWFCGREPEAGMDAAARAFAADFRMIEPDAAIRDRDEVLAMLRGARGRRPADFAIEVVHRDSRALGRDLVLVTYDEHQRMSGKASARRSSAVFEADEAAPQGVLWRFLQETWITETAAS